MPLYETVLIARNDLSQQQVDTITDQIGRHHHRSRW
jgi:small subunit ribosomal protein S6